MRIGGVKLLIPPHMTHRRWRVGRKLGRTLYIMVGDEPSDDDQLIGMMDTEELAVMVQDVVNAHIEAVRNELDWR
jgi:hypothetical protein